MLTKTKEKQKARRLRKQGLSYNEILEKIPVAKSSVSLWCGDIRLTPLQRTRINKKQKKNQQRFARFAWIDAIRKRQQEIKDIRKNAKKEIKRLSLYELTIAGLMVYWAEGSKTSRAEITNSNPILIKFMIRWFRSAWGIPASQLKARLNIHSNQNDKKIKEYWHKVTKIPLKNFGKSFIKPKGTGHRKNILKNGVIRIGISNENLRHHILTSIKAIYLNSINDPKMEN